MSITSCVEEPKNYHMNIDLKGQPSHYTAQQSAQQLRSFRLLSRFYCASASIISSFLATTNHLLTNTYKSTVQTVDPNGEKVRFVCLFPLQIQVCFIFYEGTTAAGITLNDEKFGMLYGKDKNSICVDE